MLSRSDGLTKLLYREMAKHHIFLLAIVLVTLCGDVKAQLYVSVYNTTTSLRLSDDLQYNDNTLFSHQYANVDDLSGFIHVPVPRNACSYLPPLPAEVSNQTWFALVFDYPACPYDMLVNVRASGYTMVIAAVANESALQVPADLADTGFPVLLLPDSYASTLREVASSSVQYDPEIRLEVQASIFLSVFSVLISFVACCSCCCLACCGCRCYYRHRRRAMIREDLINYQRVQGRDRNANQELIESILRQLQALQADIPTHTPLGAAETQRLPLGPYSKERSKCERCVICVEDFVSNETLRWLPCNHCFHPQCIDVWLGQHSSVCPLCKSPVVQTEATIDTDSSISDYPLVSHSPNSNYGSV